MKPAIFLGVALLCGLYELFKSERQKLTASYVVRGFEIDRLFIED